MGEGAVAYSWYIPVEDDCAAPRSHSTLLKLSRPSSSRYDQVQDVQRFVEGDIS